MLKVYNALKQTIFTVAGLILISSLIGCTGKLSVPLYGSLKGETDTHITAYSDADVKIDKDGSVRSDDTTLIVLALKRSDQDDLNKADISSIFNNAITQIAKIFKYRKEVYKEWVENKGE